jgi:NAD(P)-dependent dehydrogenase (short-subunit alcohol dehydrogenase family)
VTRQPLCDGRICIVTGAGRGIGREYALSLAAHGARLLVNDLGGSVTGEGRSIGPAQDVVDEIVAAGGTAVANGDDIATWDGAQSLVQSAVDAFGGLDVLINNAGILRDRMLANMSEQEWDSVIQVHLKGSFATTRWAAQYWRAQAKAGAPRKARIINTTSASGIYGKAGQANYGAAKAGIAALTVIGSLELARYAITVNAVAPLALTRMTDGLSEITEERRRARAPHWPAPIVTWLASTESDHVTGRVFEASGDCLAIAEGWRRGPSVPPLEDARDVGAVVEQLLAKAAPNSAMNGAPSRVTS